MPNYVLLKRTGDDHAVEVARTEAATRSRARAKVAKAQGVEPKSLLIHTLTEWKRAAPAS